MCFQLDFTFQTEGCSTDIKPIKEFTGISDPYDVPEKPEVRIETENVDVDDCALKIILKLENMGLIPRI